MKRLIAGLLTAGILFGATGGDMMENVHSEKIDEVFQYFDRLGRHEPVDEKLHAAYFSDDFKMIINGTIVLSERGQMKEHFEHLQSQMKSLDVDIHEKIVAEDKCVMRYSFTKDGVPSSKVIAIFKFRDGKIYEMNEVAFQSANEKFDFMSK